MSNRMGEHGRMVTLLRGDALREVRGTDERSGPVVVTGNRFRPAGDGPSKTESSSNANTSIYGVPISAVQHCCGRGCKHCRIYWYRMKS